MPDGWYLSIGLVIDIAKLVLEIKASQVKNPLFWVRITSTISWPKKRDGVPIAADRDPVCPSGIRASFGLHWSPKSPMEPARRTARYVLLLKHIIQVADELLAHWGEIIGLVIDIAKLVLEMSIWNFMT